MNLYSNTLSYTQSDEREPVTRASRALVKQSLQRVERWSAGKRATGNALIHGDNLEVLKLLTQIYEDAVKCIYLDPPYNNGESYEHYFDSMGHEEWLKSVSLRLEQARILLRKDGSVWISIDDSELHYLKVAADEIFGRKNFVGTVAWEHRTTRENRKVFSQNHEYLLVYAKDINAWTKARNSLPLTDEVVGRYKNPDADPRGPWQSVSANVQDGHGTPQQYYSLRAPNGKLHSAPKGRCWVYTKSKMMKAIANNEVWFGSNGNGVPRLKRFLKDRKVGLTPETLWRADSVGTTSEAKKHLLALFKNEILFDTPKPEHLIHRVLHISTNPGDLVLDAYLGSGTTAAVAHKMGRAYIGIENGDHIKTHCAHRLKQVIDGEGGGISSLIHWNGGGGFDYFEFKDRGRRAK
ncbi:MAG TPA: site-specific DNA-methyltransferase [Gammaproteobacteria bacterium]|jgi:adenine-specific DNA-methyltransferase|nr:site-specific DNA-methyltransferase [Gammaproteobacteria bacterium]